MEQGKDENAPRPGARAIFERLRFWIHAMILHFFVRTIAEFLWSFVPVSRINGTLDSNLASEHMLKDCWIFPREGTTLAWGEERRMSAAAYWEDGWFIYWKGWNSLFVHVGRPIGPDTISDYLAPSPNGDPPPGTGQKEGAPDRGPGREEYAQHYVSQLRREFQVFGVAAERQRFMEWAVKSKTEKKFEPGESFSLTYAARVYVSGVGSASSKLDNFSYEVACTDPTLGVNMQAWEQLRARAEYVLEHSEKYRNMGASPITNVLLYGPPGTGKTTLVQRLAAAMGCPVEFARLPSPKEEKIIPINVDDPDFDVEGLSRAVSNYQKLLAGGMELWEARRRESTGWRYSGETTGFRGVSQIVLFDDFDRTFDGMVKGPLLTEMLRFLESRSVPYPVMHVACCNRIDLLPPALLNRFHILHVEALSTEQIAQILRVWFEGDPDVDAVASELDGKLHDLRSLRAAIQQNIPLKDIPRKVEAIYEESVRLQLDSALSHQSGTAEDSEMDLEDAPIVPPTPSARPSKMRGPSKYMLSRKSKSSNTIQVEGPPLDLKTLSSYAKTRVITDPDEDDD